MAGTHDARCMRYICGRKNGGMHTLLDRGDVAFSRHQQTTVRRHIAPTWGKCFNTIPSCYSIRPFLGRQQIHTGTSIRLRRQGGGLVEVTCRPTFSPIARRLL